MTEENSENVELAENEKKKLKSGDINLTITNQTSLDQEKLWDEIRTEIQQKYQALNIPFDPSSITTKKEMEHHVAVLKTLEKGVSEFREEKQAKESGVPLSGAQTGEDTSSSSDRNIEQLRQSSKDIPISLMSFNSETELIKFLEAVSHDTNDPRCRESERLLKQVLSHVFERTGTVEYQGEAKNFGKPDNKGQWKKKRQGDD